MKALMILGTCCIVFAGCHKAGIQTPKTLHVKSVEECSDISVVATFGDKEYTLEPEGHPAYVACFSPIGPELVGKDLKASLDVARGVFTVHLDAGETPYHTHYDATDATYVIHSTREVTR
jgi:hypothetical protein